jgi:hypothetical protein
MCEMTCCHRSTFYEFRQYATMKPFGFEMFSQSLWCLFNYVPNTNSKHNMPVTLWGSVALVDRSASC